jgi:hypothetical protein
MSPQSETFREVLKISFSDMRIQKLLITNTKKCSQGYNGKWCTESTLRNPVIRTIPYYIRTRNSGSFGQHVLEEFIKDDHLSRLINEVLIGSVGGSGLLHGE